jgi:flavin reductase (DIM6/NTAB) family NADH-FMN oxidoreductase RutF
MSEFADSGTFRRVMSRFITGVTVITSRAGESIHGMTCNAFCSVTLAPPTVLVSLATASRTARLIEEGRVFAVNVLGEGQVAHSDRFAGRHKDREADRFEGFEWRTAITGAPIFPASLAYLDCTLAGAHPVGDHTLFLGEVRDARCDEAGRPLIYGLSRYLLLEHLKPVPPEAP